VATLGGLLMSIVVVLFLANIISREINRPIQGLLQLAVFATIIVVYMGLAYCEEKDEHIKIEIVASRVSPLIKGNMKIIVKIIEISILSICVYAVSLDAYSAYITKASITGTVPMILWPVKSVILAGLFLFWFQILLNLIRFIKK
jgi:TRAP-type C4-dicarboxylate transport system permease small subunit